MIQWIVFPWENPSEGFSRPAEAAAENAGVPLEKTFKQAGAEPQKNHRLPRKKAVFFCKNISNFPVTVRHPPNSAPDPHKFSATMATVPSRSPIFWGRDIFSL